MLWVVGMGVAISMSMLLIGTYALQSMKGARRGQDTSSALQAAQAGVDDVMARLNATPNYASAVDCANPAMQTPGACSGITAVGWNAVPGSSDADGAACTGTDATLPVNCPRFHYTATQSGDTVVITSVGKSRGIMRAVKVTAKKASLTDYLYYSEVEAVDPDDPFAHLLTGYSAAAKAACGYRAWGTPQRPSSGCVVPGWRSGDTTDGSRLHSNDAFTSEGSPSFNSTVTTAYPGCTAGAPTTCVLPTGSGRPSYGKGTPTYDDGLNLHDEVYGTANPTSAIQTAAAATGCVYSGPTRIEFVDDEMRVWSPQTPYTPQCGGGTADLYNLNVSILGFTVPLGDVLNPTGLPSLLKTALALLGPIGDILVEQVLGTVYNLVPTVPTAVPIPSAIYVQDNTTSSPNYLQCLVGTALGMYSTLDTNLAAGLLDSSSNPTTKCTKGTVFVSGTIDSKKTSIGTSGDITIMDNLTYAEKDGSAALGLVSNGAVQVYTKLQCVLALTTCLDLSNPIGGLQQVLGSVLQTNQVLEVDAAIAALSHRFGVLLPLLSTAADVSLLSGIVGLHAGPPTLKLYGSIAQKYRGITGADLIDLNLGPVAGVNVDIGFKVDYEYDSAFKTAPPPNFPVPAQATWAQQAFAEIPVPVL